MYILQYGFPFKGGVQFYVDISSFSTYDVDPALQMVYFISKPFWISGHVNTPKMRVFFLKTGCVMKPKAPASYLGVQADAYSGDPLGYAGGSRPSATVC